MPDQDGLSQPFLDDLRKSFQTVCRAHNVDFGSLRGWETDEGLYLLNMTAHKDSMDQFYADLYLKNAENIGLSRGWLGSYVKNPYNNESIKVIGLDPDGGEECVRVESYDRVRMNIKPSELLRIMTSRLQNGKWSG